MEIYIFTSMLKSYEKEIPTAPFSTEFNKRQIQFTDQDFIDLSWMPRISYDKFFILKLSYDRQKYGSSFTFQIY